MSSLSVHICPSQSVARVYRWQGTRVRKVLLRGLFMISAFLGVSAWAGGVAVPTGFPGLDASHFSWSAPEGASLNGIPVYWVEFTSKASFLDTARALARHHDRFQKVLVFNGALALTGVRAEWHWLAEIQPAPAGSRGRVSLLRVPVQPPGLAPENRTHSPFSWLGHKAALGFRQESLVSGRRIVQEMYNGSLPAGNLSAYVHDNLRRTGWQPDPQLSANSRMAMWRRNASRLFIMAVSAEPGSAVFLNYIE